MSLAHNVENASVRAPNIPVVAGTCSVSIRKKYEDLGVEAYYKREGANYSNPHEDRVSKLLRTVWNEWHLPKENVLDLAAGNGEVTCALQTLGIQGVEGCDPFTYEAYERRIGKKCLNNSFEDIMGGCFEESCFDIIVCSYALHLAPESKLPVLAMNLAMCSKRLLILTPHKRPVLKEIWGWKLESEKKIDRTRAMLYVSLFKV
eukprot:Nk52_evm5s265 gene=Nk52_evmTU5s265